MRLFLIRFILLFFITASLGYIASGYMTPATLAWYQSLPQAPLTPPRFVFSFVWGGLFFILSLVLAWRWAEVSLTAVTGFLAATGLWSFVFFALHDPIGAEIVLFGFLGFAIWLLWQLRHHITTALLFSLIVLWGIFALYLNTYIVCQMM